MITIKDIQDARPKIEPFIRRTPLLPNDTLGKRLKTNVYLKYELFQKTGSFKPRGAFNQILNLSDEQKKKGVVAVSGGNFAQGAAYAAQMLGIRAQICMPEYTPKNYVNGTKSYGAEVHFAPTFPEIFELARSFENDGFALIHAWDNPYQVAGNGTVGLEILEDLPDVTDVIISIGGGGLIAGNILSLLAGNPKVRIWGVETQGAETMNAALKAGKIVQIAPTSLAKTLGAPYVSEDAFNLCQRNLEDLVVVTDKEAFDAQVYLLERTKVITELAASCTLAAADKIRDRLGSHVVLLLCGGNASLANMMEYQEKLGPPAAI
jgi:threonine dehydratase